MNGRTSVGIALAFAVCAAACGSRPIVDRSATETFVRLAREDLAAGDFARAEERLARARARASSDGGVMLWTALLASLRWDFEAEVAWIRAAQDTGRGGLSEPEWRGRLGDALFRAGRYADAKPLLAAGAVGPEGARRIAFAQLADGLPLERVPIGNRVAELPLGDGPIPRVHCVIGGRERSLLFDTGAAFTTLTRTLAIDIGVKPIVVAGLGRDGLGQEFPVHAGVLDEFVLVDVPLGSHPVLVVEDGRIAVRGVDGGAPASGLIGLDVVLRFRFTLDPVRRSLVLEPRIGLPDAESVPCLLVEDALRAPISIEGRELWFVIDTGASHSSLTESGLRALPGGDRRAVEGHRTVRTPGGGWIAVREVRGVTLSVSGVRFVGVDLPIVKRVDSGLFPLHGVLGADLLLQSRMTIDSARMQMTTGR